MTAPRRPKTAQRQPETKTKRKSMIFAIPTTSLRGPEVSGGRPGGSQAAQHDPGRPQDGPRGSQDGPRIPPTHLRRPKRIPRRPQDRPRRPQDAPGEVGYHRPTLKERMTQRSAAARSVGEGVWGYGGGEAGKRQSIRGFDTPICRRPGVCTLTDLLFPPKQGLNEN